MAENSRGVLITGASGGIGRATARAFAARGDCVAVHYRHNREGAERTLAALPGSGHALVPGDLRDTAAVLAIVDHAVEALGGVSVLVNNAAEAPLARTMHRIDEVSFEDWGAAWERMIAVNLLGAAHLSWAVARHLIATASPGAIVNVGSRGAFRGEPDHPAYGATKAALHSLGQSMAIALAPHDISVTSVAPGFISSERQAHTLAGDAGEGVRGQSPFGRVGTPEEVAEAIVYLASPAAKWSSGAILDLNGASHMRM
ncbi:SDR family NAD(P)-dependent oxidoreductase [uncultured Microbacterium sp.]|nr:SDR family oxidoreductase [Microbacterium sp. UBA3394]|tara:strand:- start:10938 stop:11711 length:774 start_codon:yes stop_codon:yes gene_type:complete